MYSDVFEPHGYMSLTNTGGIEVEINFSCDGVRYRFGDGESFSEPLEAEIETFYPEDDPDWSYDDGECRQGFQTDGGQIYYMEQFMRCGI